MGRKLSKQGQLVLEALKAGRLKTDAGGFKRRLAKILYNENPEFFKSVENVRDIIRHLTGNQGIGSRNPNKNDKSQLSRQEYPYKVPTYDVKMPQVVELPKSRTRIGIIADIHIPYHHMPTINKSIQYWKEKEVNTIIFNGDCSDCEAISKYDKKQAASLNYELDVLYEVLSLYRDEFPDTKMYYKIGNHEDRFERMFHRKNPEIANAGDYGFAEIASLNDFKVQVIASEDCMVVQGFHIYHGHEFKGGSAVYPAKGLFNKTFGSKNLIIGHLHVTDSFSRPGSKEVHVMGCACMIPPKYDPSSIFRWNNGFGYLEGGKFENIRI